MSPAGRVAAHNVGQGEVAGVETGNQEATVAGVQRTEQQRAELRRVLDPQKDPCSRCVRKPPRTREGAPKRNRQNCPQSSQRASIVGVPTARSGKPCSVWAARRACRKQRASVVRSA